MEQKKREVLDTNKKNFYFSSEFDNQETVSDPKNSGQQDKKKARNYPEEKAKPRKMISSDVRSILLFFHPSLAAQQSHRTIDSIHKSRSVDGTRG